MRNVAVDGPRLWATIHETARIGATPKGGVRRLTLTDLDRQARDWFVEQVRALGCEVMVDDLGNIFATRAGRNPALPPIAIGSHLDTQPTGGKYDGIIGVLGGLEVLRTLHDLSITTEHPIAVIDWTNEEGSRFAPAMLASGVYAGAFDRAFADSRTDRDGVTFGAALDAIGYRGTEACGARKLAAHFELHIEQGPILEAEGATIGVVTGVQGMRWFEVMLHGSDAHAGSTPMPMRRDALVAAARIVSAVRGIALDHAPDAVSTVGLIEARPNSRNVIPGEVFLTVDMRHPDDAVLAAMEARLREAVDDAAEHERVHAVVTPVWNNPAVRFDAGCVQSVRAMAEALGLPARDIVSGAGHDSAYVARVAPTTMIFVPCAGGLSHNEAESATEADVVAGANVLLRAVLDTDQRLFERKRADARR